MNRLLSNTSWIMFGQIIQMVISFFVGILSTRYLGPSNYGVITYVASYVAFFSSIGLMGMDTVIVSRLVKDPDHDGEEVASAVALRTFVSLLCMAAMILVVAVVEHGDRMYVMVALLSGFELVFKAFGTIGFWYQYKLMSRRTAIADTIAFLIASAYRIYLLATHASLYGFAFYTSLIYLLEGLFYWILFHKDCTHPIRPDRTLCRELLHACIPYLVSGVMISLYTQVDRLMIKWITGSAEEVGYYSCAYVVSNLIAFIPNSLALSARPVLLDLKSRQAPEYETRVTQVMAAMIWFSMFYSVFITIFAGPVVNLLYGTAYLEAVAPLRILVWVSLVENLTRIRDLWLIGAEQSRFVTWFSVSGTVGNIILNAILIPVHGISGAAAATVITQFAVIMILPACFEETRQFAIDAVHALTLHNVHVRDLWNEIRTSFRGREKKA